MALFEETYIADIVGRNKVLNQGVLEDILNILSSSVGSLTNPNKLSNTFKSVKKKNVSAPTIKKYIGFSAIRSLSTARCATTFEGRSISILCSSFISPTWG